MKHAIKLLASVLIILAVAYLTSCNDPMGKNNSNPTEVGLKAAAFEVTMLDHERGYEKDSLYVFEGIWKQNAFYFGYWKLDPMVPNILPEGKNRIEFRISSEAAGFEGVNASSSSRCINVVQDGSDHTRYHLEYVSEGESTITFWNGEGATRKEISFTATSKSVIPMEGVLARLDGKEYRFLDGNNPSSNQYQKLLKTFKSRNDFPGWDKLHVLEIVGPIPLNATPEDGKKYTMICKARLAYLDDDGNGCDWDIYDTEDEIRSLRYNDPEMQIRHFPDYRWFDEKHWIGDPREKDPHVFVPADFRERRIMLWSVKTRADTYGKIALIVEWIKSDDNFNDWFFYVK